MDGGQTAMFTGNARLWGETPLHLAAAYASADIVQMFPLTAAGGAGTSGVSLSGDTATVTASLVDPTTGGTFDIQSSSEGTYVYKEIPIIETSHYKLTKLPISQQTVPLKSTINCF